MVYSERRAARVVGPSRTCPVCDGLTCSAVDVLELGDDDAAYLAPNLYPITFPSEDARAGSRGVHLVQWSSLRHEGGLDETTAATLFQQLAEAEALLLHDAPAEFPDVGEGHRGHVAIVKNRGRRVGGSVEHDHQQLLFGAARPAEPARARGLGPRLREEAPRSLVVAEIGGAAVIVPPFMRRPLHAFVVPAGPEAGALHHMEAEARADAAVAAARLCASVDALMRADGGEAAWNLVLHTGPGVGPLFEMRAFTQPLGGFEHLGLYLCEERPETSAGRLQEAFASA